MKNDYYNLIDSFVSKTIIDSNFDFYDLVLKCAGIHPIELINSLKRNEINGILDKSFYEQIMHSAALVKNNELDGQYRKILPVPHQIDFDWRFSNKGIEYFTNRIEELIRKRCIKRIVFIGLPSLFRHYCGSKIQNVEFFLIDFNASKHICEDVLPSNAHVLNCNLNYDLDMELKVDKIFADLVVIDPPWYPEYFKKFFDICNIVGSDNCHVFGVFPPVLTRESIATEKDGINEYIRVYGFEVLQFENMCVEYFTPPFEKNVLKVNGINNYPICWRNGDFIETFRTQKPPTSPHNTGVAIKKDGWSEISIKNVRFKLYQSAFTEDKEFNIRLDSIYKDDIYPSVSRRFKGSEKINVWTSGNRVFYCSNIPILFMILENIYDDDIVTSFERNYDLVISDFQRHKIEELKNYFIYIIDLEMEEYGNWVK